MSVWPSIFLYAKNTQNLGKQGCQCQCLFQWPATSYCHQRSGPSLLADTDPSNSDTTMFVCVGRVCARVREGACACMCAFVRDVFAIYDNNI